MPLIFMMICGLVGLLVGVAYGVTFVYTALIGVASLVGAFALSARIPVLLCLGITAVAWMAILGSEREAPSLPAHAGTARLTVQVVRTACGSEGCWAEVSLLACTQIDEGACPDVVADARLSLTTQEELPTGARVTVLAKVTGRPAFRNPLPSASWPDARMLLRARALGSARIDDVSLLSRAVTAARGAVRGVFQRSLSDPHAGIARALLLGEGMAVATELNEAIRNAGVSHVLAVSGMHVTVLAGALVALLRMLWLRSPFALRFEAARVAAGLGVLLAPLVARLCGGAPSAWRSAFTSTLLYALIAMGYRPSALHVSAFAVVLHALYEPREALHPGFILSVLATGALLTASQSEAGLRGAFKESFRAWLSTAPYLALCFGTSSLVALIANVVLLPLGALLIPLAVLHLGMASLHLADALFVRFLFETASGAFLQASRLCSDMDPGLLIPPLTLTQGIALTVLSVVWLTRWRFRTRLLCSLVCGMAIGVSEWQVRHPLGDDELRVTFLDVGQGDSILIETGRGETALIDAGGAPNGGPDPGREAVVPLLRALRIKNLKLVVLSHPHPDHYGGLRAVLEAVRVEELWDTGQAESEGDTGAASELLAFARSRGVRVVTPEAPCRAAFALGTAKLQALSPCPRFDDALGANDNSWVLRLTHEKRSFLLTGDAEHITETTLVETLGEALRSDVLKVGHHGSRSSSTEAFVQAVAPWLSVVSAGQNNRFGHPHAEVETRLSAAGKLLRTDQHGGVQVWSDGSTLRARAWDEQVALSFTP